MRDQYNRASVLLQVAFEPRNAFGIEMVGRLVQEQEVGTFEQDLAKCHASAFTAGKRADLGVAGRQAHRVHGDFNAAIEVPSLGGFDRVLYLGLFVEQGVHKVGVRAFGKLGVDLVEAR